MKKYKLSFSLIIDIMLLLVVISLYYHFLGKPLLIEYLAEQHVKKTQFKDVYLKAEGKIIDDIKIKDENLKKLKEKNLKNIIKDFAGTKGEITWDTFLSVTHDALIEVKASRTSPSGKKDSVLLQFYLDKKREHVELAYVEINAQQNKYLLDIAKFLSSPPH